MIPIKSKEEIELVRQSALVVSQALGEVAKLIKPGVTPLYLDKIIEEFIRDNGGVPSFKGYNDFPNAACISVNERVVHGIPNDRPLEEGDVVSVDIGVFKNGFHGDHAYTFAVGQISPEAEKLLRVTKECLYLGIEQMKKGNRIGDISFAVQNHAHRNGFGVVKELVGHGVGRELHEEPGVPNLGKRGNGKKIENGWVLAIEPMINMGVADVEVLADKWTIVTKDRKPSAHFEHNVALIDGKPVILSTFEYVEKALGLLPA